MPFLKQTFMWIFFIVAMYLGGSSTQSSSNMLQGMGFVSIVMALVCLYIIFKLMWGARGTITTIIVIGAVVLYCAYTLGLFNGKSIGGIMTGEAPPPQQVTETDEDKQAQQTEMESLDAELFGADTPDEESEEQADAKQAQQQQQAQAQRQAQAQQQQQQNSGGLVGQIKTMLFGNQSNQNQSAVQNMDINPFDYPAISGYAKVVTGSTLYVNGLNVKMYGIDAPDISQTCADSHGRGYYCGREARSWLQDWLNNRDVTCHILGKVENGWATGTCFVENNKFDVAAVVVNAGWAVAFTQNTDVYVEYERQAKANRRGLWAGTFYKPWDWRKIQNRKVDIKIKYNAPQPIQQKKKKSGFDFWGLF